MKISGTIYKAEAPKKTKESPIVKKTKKLAKKAVSYLGLGLTSFSMSALIFLYTPDLNRQTDPRPSLKLAKEEVKPKPETQDLSYLTQRQTAYDEAKSYGVDVNFSVVVPTLNISSKIIPNVDYQIESSYLDALSQGVAHAKGTAVPAEGSVYLFSHSTSSPAYINEYNAVFYSLKDIKEGEEIIIFYKNKKYSYKVTEKLIVNPEETDWIKPSSEQRLILQTCYPPGTSIKRLLVIAKPV